MSSSAIPQESAAQQLPAVFIGSSSEALEIAENLQDALQSSNVAEVTIWQQGFFQLSGGTLESLVGKAADFDFAIMIVTPDTQVSARGSEFATPRANVLFEIGLFIGLLGRTRTFIVMCENDKVELPSDLLGATIAKFPRRKDGNLKAAMTSAVIAIREAIRNLGPRMHDVSNERQTLFALSDSGEFVTHMEHLLSKARRVVLIGTGLNILQRDPVRLRLIERAAAGDCELEIYLADPFSPAVENRLIEEEAGAMKPPVGKSGLLLRLETLLDDWQRHGSPKNVRIRLFTHYPTFALLIVDEEHFIYPYGYATLGNFSPVIRLTEHQSAHVKPIQFLRSHYERVRNVAVDAGLKMQLREGLGIAEETLHPFAVYFVPPKGSPLYQLGSQVLGYDVRQGAGVSTDWAPKVGEAANFGFHLTVCDALYFLNEEEVALAAHEVAFIAKDYAPFELVRLRVASQFPDEHSVAIVGDDPSGTLEALHCEFVTRVYRRAAASNYSLGKAAPTRDDNLRRAELMIRRFRAPYILQRYRPHFTLLTSVESEEREEFTARLQGLLALHLPSLQIRVDKLSLMGKLPGNSAWRLVRDVSLG